MHARHPLRALAENFLGAAPGWYKLTIVGFLLTNPLLLVFAGPIVTGWAIVLEFIFTLATALKCYPLQSGGLLVLEAVALGLASPASVYEEASRNLSVLLLLVFMVAGVYFLKELLLFVFTKLLLGVRSPVALALLFCAVAAVLSAFLDALTVTAVLVTIAQGFYAVYHKVASGKQFRHDHDPASDDEVHELHRRDLDNFRAFLRGLLMHALVGTALGGMMTLVGEPQNLLIAQAVGWDFSEFFLRVAPVSLPVFAVGLGTCVALELGRAFGFGVSLPGAVRSVLVEFDAEETRRRSARERAVLWVQASVAVMLVLALGLHLAEVGIVGLGVIVLATALNGVVEEKRLGRAFEEALPFTALLVVFFGVVAVIHEQHLFVPITERVLALDGRHQTAVLYLANGLLSAVSDNVFVASVYVNEVAQAFENGVIGREQFELLAVAINAGTNVPSVATPNGQAAFLFLLTSAIAPLIRLSYGRMVWMALPYAVTLTATGLFAIVFLL